MTTAQNQRSAVSSHASAEVDRTRSSNSHLQSEAGVGPGFLSPLEDAHIFVALVDQRGCRPRQRVGLTQSGASNALAQLRLVFDDPLFERSGRGVRPTARALEVAPDVHAGIAALARAIADREFAPQTLQRTMVFAMPDQVQAVLLPDLVATLARHAPGVRVRAIAWPRQVVPDGVARGEIDFFAGYAAHVPEGLSSTVLYDESYAAMCRAGHPALSNGALPLDAWLEHGHVIVSSEPEGPTAVDRRLGDMGLRREVVVRVENALLLPGLLCRTNLIALVDRRLGMELQRPELALVDPPVDLPRSRVRLVWGQRAPDPAREWLKDRILQLVHEATSDR